MGPFQAGAVSTAWVSASLPQLTAHRSPMGTSPAVLSSPLRLRLPRSTLAARQLQLRSVPRHVRRRAAANSEAGVDVKEKPAAETPRDDEASSAADAESDSDSFSFLDGFPGWLLTAIAGIGAADSGYLLLVKLGYIPLTCPTDASGAACETVLNSQWASIGPVPLPLFGLLAYTAVGLLALRPGWRESTDLFVLCLAMGIASLVLVGILLAVLKASCVYCAVSAFTTALLLGLVAAIQGRKKEFYSRRRALALAGVVAAGAAGDLTLFSAGARSEDGEEAQDFYSLAQRYKPEHPPVRNTSTKATIALARHLKEVGAKCYSAWWCPHCQEQREMFGAEAVEVAPFVECSTVSGKQNDVCKAANIDGYPQWVIGGETYKGAQPLGRLAEISGFKAFAPESFEELPEEATSYIWS